MRYQIRYEDNIDIVNDEIPSLRFMAKHFALYGYDPLYVYQNGLFNYVITYKDFCKERIITSRNRNFIRKYDKKLDRKRIEADILSNLDEERLIYVSDDHVVCEINTMTELPLLNSLSKNIMALRYLSLFHSEMNEYLQQFNAVVIISADDIYYYWKKIFDNIKFYHISNIDEKIQIGESNYIVFDFVFNKKLRKLGGYNIKNVVELCKILTKFALQKIQILSKKRNVILKFYKIPRFNYLTCLSKEEIDIYNNKTSLGTLIGNDEFIERFIRCDGDKEILRHKEYYSSQRIDDGFCFVMDECVSTNFHVHNGIRSNGMSVKPYRQNINFFGPCTTYGICTKDDCTISSLVQQYAINNGYEVFIKNLGGINGDNELNSLMQALVTPVSSGDINIILDFLEDCPDYLYNGNLKCTETWFNNSKKNFEIQFIDQIPHCNYDANQIFANGIIDDIKWDDLIDLDNNVCKEPLIDLWADFEDVLPVSHIAYRKQKNRLNESNQNGYKFGKIGAIIINDTIDENDSLVIVKKCLEECDFLYVLIFNDETDLVEENLHRYEALNNMLNINRGKLILMDHFFNKERYLDSDKYFRDTNKYIQLISNSLTLLLRKQMGVNLKFNVNNDGQIIIEEN